MKQSAAVHHQHHQHHLGWTNIAELLLGNIYQFIFIQQRFRADGILLPNLRQALDVGCYLDHFMQDFKTKYLNLSFLGKIFLGFIFLGSFIKGLTNTYELVFSTYQVNENQIYKVDTFRLQGKAFYNSGGKYNSPSYDFSSTNGYTFNVSKKIFQGIVDKKQFADTFCYHDLQFIAYSDSLTADEYIKNKEPIFINTFQLQVGTKKYISIDKVNKEYKNKLTRNILLTSFLLLVILIPYLSSRKMFN